MTVSITLPPGLVGALLAKKGEQDDLSSLVVAALVDRLDLLDRFGGEAEHALASLLAYPEMIDAYP